MAKKLSDIDDDFLDEFDDDEKDTQETKPRANKKDIFIKFGIIIVVAVAVFFCVRALIKSFKGEGGLRASRKHIGIEHLFTQKEGSYPLVSDGELSEYRVYEFENTLYLNRKYVVENIDCRFYYDKEADTILYTAEDETYTFFAGKDYYEDSKGKEFKCDYIPVVKNDNGFYIAVNIINFKRVMFKYCEYDNPKRYSVWTYDMEGEFDNYKIKSDTALREGNSVKKDILLDLKKGDFVTVLDDTDEDFFYVVVQGVHGYVEKKSVESKAEKPELFVVDEPFKSAVKDYQIKLGWAQVTNASANGTILEYVANTKGLTTISPTWYQVENAKGDMISFVDADIVKALKKDGYEVWPLVSDFINDVNSKELLSSREARINIINRLITDAKKYGFDGYNIDFEDITKESAEDFLQFIRELSVECRKLGLVLSIDNYVPMDHTEFYNRGEQGKVADYVIVMAYDEHYAGSPESGSVSSLPFVKTGIENTVSQVGDSRKVIVALPFYSRIWSETYENGSMSLSSKAYGIKSLSGIISQNVSEENIIWNEELGQNYAQYAIDNVTYKCWIEDASSLEAKLKAASAANVGGVAFWRLGFEDSSIYDTVGKY